MIEMIPKYFMKVTRRKSQEQLVLVVREIEIEIEPMRCCRRRNSIIQHNTLNTTN